MCDVQISWDLICSREFGKSRGDQYILGFYRILRKLLDHVDFDAKPFSADYFYKYDRKALDFSYPHILNIEASL